MPRTTIVIPCYNEARRLDCAKLLDFAANNPQRLMLVNDGSTDGTADMLNDLVRRSGGRITARHLAQNGGKAEAVRQGMLAALRDNADFIGFWDADLATPLTAIASFCEVLESRLEMEMVFGARVPLMGRAVQRRPARHVTGRIFAATAWFTLGMRVYDTQCGAKLFRASPRLAQIFARPFTSRWIFDVEILARLIAQRVAYELPPLAQAIYELPLTEWQDVAGSKLKPRDFARAAWDLAAIHRKYLRRLSSEQRQRAVYGCDQVAGLAVAPTEQEERLLAEIVVLRAEIAATQNKSDSTARITSGVPLQLE